MKNQSILLIAIASAFCAFQLSAQDNGKETKGDGKEFKTEFNIGVANIFASPIYDLITYDYLDNYPEAILNYPQRTSLIAGFKFHDPKGAFRLSTNIHYSHQKVKYDDTESNENTYNSFQSILNLGYEWHSNFNKVTIFYGFDLSGGYKKFKSERIDFLDFNTYEHYTITYGASPLIGVNYYITSNLSLGTELKYNIAAYAGKSKSEYNYAGSPNSSSGETENKLSGIQTFFGPLGYLSVNIHF
jgi:hypothetical protein